MNVNYKKLVMIFVKIKIVINAKLKILQILIILI